MAIKDYEVLTPSSEIPLMPAGERWGPNTVNYAVHPAYDGLIDKRKFKLGVFVRFAKSFLNVLVKRLIRYESIPLDCRNKGGVAFLRQALKNAFSGWGVYSPDVKGEGFEEAFQNFDQNGICALKIPAAEREKLFQVSSGSFEFLRNRREGKIGEREFEESRSYKVRSQEPELFETIEGILENSNIVDLASKYKGRKLKLIDVNPQINDSTDDFWQRVFPDTELDVPRTAYYHRDASGGDVKVIFYINDVRVQNGAFCYTLGSNKMVLSKLDDYICEANDSNGLAGTKPNAREDFVSLPKFVRQKGAFGNDLTSNDELYSQVVKSEWRVEADAGSVVMFDTKGIHRGGLVTEGERLVITCVLG